MKANEIVREIMKLKEVRPSMLASRLNIKNNVLSERLGQRNLSTEKLNEMVKAMDYKIVVMPRENRIPDNAFEVEV